MTGMMGGVPQMNPMNPTGMPGMNAYATNTNMMGIPGMGMPGMSMPGMGAPGMGAPGMGVHGMGAFSTGFGGQQ